MNASFKTHQHEINPFGGGCSALSFATQDGKHLLARNYDYPSAQGTAFTFIPRNYEFFRLQHDPNIPPNVTSFACIGMGFLGYASAILYDGVNEKGLCGSMLLYPEYARDSKSLQGEHPINAAFYLTAVLTECASIEDALLFFENNSLAHEELIPGVQIPAHYLLTDLSGETIVVEPSKDGFSVFRNSIGVLTNAPDYEWHVTNLRNYLTVKSSQPTPQKILGDTLEPLSVGAGGLGLPGDFTSPSRFVRLAFAKDALPEAKDERDGVTKMMSALGCVTIPQGFAHNGEGAIEETLYSAVMCCESMTYYLSLYSNRRLTSYNLKVELDGHEVKQFTLPLSQDIAMGNF